VRHYREEDHVIEQSDVDGILQMVRAHYRYGLQMGNLLYWPPLDTERKRNRNRAAEKADARITQSRRYFEEHDISLWKRGRMLANDGYAAGNCMEMSLVAIHFCYETRSFLDKAAQIFFVETTGWGSMADHGFVMVSDNTLTDPITNFRTIRQMSHVDTGLWIIDAWLNIACPANVYFGMILTRMYTMRSMRLGVAESIARDEDGYMIATPRSTHRYETYPTNLVNSPLEFHIARSPNVP
jgi:hypothetical protein